VDGGGDEPVSKLGFADCHRYGASDLLSLGWTFNGWQPAQRQAVS
jgi:hypothetical protein